MDGQLDWLRHPLILTCGIVGPLPVIPTFLMEEKDEDLEQGAPADSSDDEEDEEESEAE